MEFVREWIRDVLGYKSPVYRFAAWLSSVYFAIVREGTTGVKVLRMRGQSGEGAWIECSSLLHPIFIRPGTTDIESIIDNVFREEYGRLPSSFTPQTILDAGAYIGDTSTYFLSRFPKARLVALEPNPESYFLARMNLRAYGDRVVLMQSALWKLEGTINLVGNETGARVSDEGYAIEATTVPAVLTELGVTQLDLLKMDIEGAEEIVLRSGVNGWLNDVKVLLLETHGKEIVEAVLPLLSEAGFSVQRHRNVWYCLRKDHR